MRFFPEGKVYNFMRHRRLAMAFSALLIAASIVVFFVPGPTMGTDFIGGTEVELAFNKPVDLGDVREAITDGGFSEPDVIFIDGGDLANRYMIRVEEVASIPDSSRKALMSAMCYGENLDLERCPADKQSEEVKFSPGGEKITVRFVGEPDLDAVAAAAAAVPGLNLRDTEKPVVVQDAREHKVEILLKSQGEKLMDALATGLRANYGEVVPEHPLRVEWIGPKAGAQLRDAAIKSVIILLVLVMLYIAFRFDLRFAPGAVISLIHDAVLTMGVLTVLGVEINLATVAALLTIVGYSVNDTVVVFDRVRENLGRMRGSSFVTIINSSLSDMLGRTVLTSLTTALSLLVLFIVGTGTLKSFSGTLVLGIVFGTYSSIYVALPVTEWFDRKFFSKMGTGKKRQKPVRRKAEAAV